VFQAPGVLMGAEPLNEIEALDRLRFLAPSRRRHDSDGGGAAAEGAADLRFGEAAVAGRPAGVANLASWTWESAHMASVLVVRCLSAGGRGVLAHDHEPQEREGGYLGPRCCLAARRGSTGPEVTGRGAAQLDPEASEGRTL